MRFLIVVPARGGSKGIPQKNIYPVNGRPLIEYTLDIATKAELLNTDIVVSTDSEKIKTVAEKYKDVTVIRRPGDISGDQATTEAALLHALDIMEEENNVKYDAVITMQPTSPLRTVETLKKIVKKYEQEADRFDALLSLSENRGDFWICKEENVYERLYKNAPRRRQERKPIYLENSAYYVTSTKALRETKSVLGTHVNGFVIPEMEGIDINEPEDIWIAKFFLDLRNEMNI